MNQSMNCVAMNILIKIPKDICRDCGSCCHGKPGQFVFVRRYDDKSPEISAKGKCQHLNSNNACKLGYRKPLECQIYPLRIFADGVYVDKNCPAWEHAIQQWYILHDKTKDEWNGLNEADYKKVSI